MRRSLSSIPLLLLLAACRGSGDDTGLDSGLTDTDTASIDDTADTSDTTDTADTADTGDTGDTDDTHVEPPTGSPDLLNPNIADLRESPNYTLHLTLGDPITAERSTANYTLRLGAGTLGIR